MSLALAVLLERVADGDGPVAQVLPVHGFYGRVRSLETRVVDEREAFGVAGFRVALDFRRREDDAESGECVVQQFLVDFRVEVSDEDVGADVEVLLMRRRFIDPYRFAEQFYHVHYFDGVVRVVFAQELDEPVALVQHGDAVLRHVHVHHGPRLHEQLPQQSLVDLIVQPAHVDRGVLVPLRHRPGRHGRPDLLQIFFYLL